MTSGKKTKQNEIRDIQDSDSNSLSDLESQRMHGF